MADIWADLLEVCQAVKAWAVLWEARVEAPWEAPAVLAAVPEVWEAHAAALADSAAAPEVWEAAPEAVWVDLADADRNSGRTEEVSDAQMRCLRAD